MGKPQASLPTLDFSFCLQPAAVGVHDPSAALGALRSSFTPKSNKFKGEFVLHHYVCHDDRPTTGIVISLKKSMEVETRSPAHMHYIHCPMTIRGKKVGQFVNVIITVVQYKPRSTEPPSMQARYRSHRGEYRGCKGIFIKSLHRVAKPSKYQ